MNKTENQLSKRSFIKTALRGSALLLGIHMIDSIGFFIGVKRSLIGEAHAQGTCSTSMNCSGGSGKCSTAMDCSGSVIITNVRLGCRESFAGNVHEPSIIENYRNSPMLEKCKHLTVDNIKGCSKCFIRYVCGGACRARTFYECGKIDVSGKFCEYKKQAFIDGIFKLYSQNALQDYT